MIGKIVHILISSLRTYGNSAVDENGLERVMK